MREKSENGSSSRSEAEEGRAGAEEKGSEEADRKRWVNAMMRQLESMQGVQSDFDYVAAGEICMGFLRGLRVTFGQEATEPLKPFIDRLSGKDVRAIEAVLFGLNSHRIRKAEREGRL